MAQHRKQPKTGTVTKTGIMMGRAGTVVPQDDVEMWASLGCTDKEIADYYGVNEDTFRYNCADALISGRHQLRTGLRRAQLRVAMEGNPTMLIWLGKNMLKQSEQGQATGEAGVLPFSDDIDDVATDDAEETIDEDVNDE
jgi:hypothetical protein